ncbi:MAG: nitrous oxide reductase accessory protein NosL [Sulfurovum sp.]|nr:nitrous oxide reductase accessory protein NosL [Sulfurovum sp.]MCB4751338.1 nitrous oxide reductase accessory protein NosL [Sulfurovum sp.]MCB4778569.1 nitrous oxide reductase accessory protein NosL [Sulfurovum sp.]MCB4779960.1 nitrous oxide reductase accessory protein NosL [Sulfurovum sp.]MCB4782467.1 nitrous oxide reductase accessory protein NosL [Sulfurovum sp.]
MKILLILASLLGLFYAQEPFNGKIMVLKQQLDPVYQIPLKEDSKWQCEAILKSRQKAFFVSVKSMMQVYWHQSYFKKNSLLLDDIDKLYIKDFLNGKKIEANKAFYLFGSRVVGPHGDDLIPFVSQQNAKLFKLKHGGTKILPFSRLSKGLIRYLDM